MSDRLLMPFLVLSVGLLGLSERGIVQTAPTESSSEVLKDSELEYGRSGGFAGLSEKARLAAKDGVIRVEYLPAAAVPNALPETGQMPADEYVALWKKLEDAGLWTTQIAPPPTGADFIRHTLRARVADKSRELIWVDASSPTREARQLGDLVREAARTAIKK